VCNMANSYGYLIVMSEEYALGTSTVYIAV